MPDKIDVPIVHRLLFIAFYYYCYYVSLLFLNLNGFEKTMQHACMTFTLQILQIPFSLMEIVIDAIPNARDFQ